MSAATFDDGVRTVPAGQDTPDAAGGEFHEVVPGTTGPPGMVASAVGYRSARPRPDLHRGLPSPYLTLLFSLDGPLVAGNTAGQAHGPDAVRRDTVVAGLHQSPAYVLQPERQAGIQLAVHPLAARALFGLPAAALGADLFPSGADVLGTDAVHVHERMCEQTGWDERFATLRDFLRRRLAAADDAPAARPEVAGAWAWLARRRGAGTLDGLAAHVALSPRRLTTLFRAETGVSPKQAAGLMRFDRARRLLAAAVAAHRPQDLAGTAAASGYYDHSHLVRDFRRYTGLSPTAWVAEECRNIQAAGPRHGENRTHGQHIAHPATSRQRLAHAPGP